MNFGRIAAAVLVIGGVVAGAAMYWLQVYAYYQPVTFTPGQEIRLTAQTSGQPEPIAVEGAEGIDADSSPLRFRACFTTTLSQAALTQTYQPYPAAEPLNAPGWFGCFDAAAIGAALEQGQALAFLSEHDIHPGVDRVVAVFPDGRAYAWHQLNDEMKD